MAKGLEAQKTYIPISLLNVSNHFYLKPLISLVEYVLPPYKRCSQKFILEVAIKEKKHLKRSDMCPKLPPTAKELDVKNVYHDIV